MLNLIPSPARPGLMRLSTGCFTVNRLGHVIASTLPQTFPQAQMQSIAQRVLAAFRAAHEAQIPLNELVFRFSALTLTARELHGGAIAFLATRSLAPSN